MDLESFSVKHKRKINIHKKNFGNFHHSCFIFWKISEAKKKKGFIEWGQTNNLADVITKRIWGEFLGKLFQWLAL